MSTLGVSGPACNTTALPHRFDAAFMQCYLGPALPATARTTCPQVSTYNVHTRSRKPLLLPTACCRASLHELLLLPTAQACLAAGWDVVVAEEVGLDDTTLQQLAGEGGGVWG